MATSLAAVTARRAAALARLSPSATRAAAQIRRRGFSGAAGPPEDGNWSRMELLAIVAVSWFNVYTFNSLWPLVDENDKEEKVTEPEK